MPVFGLGKVLKLVLAESGMVLKPGMRRLAAPAAQSRQQDVENNIPISGAQSVTFNMSPSALFSFGKLFSETVHVMKRIAQTRCSLSDS
jgi:hypothetical protein